MAAHDIFQYKELTPEEVKQTSEWEDHAQPNIRVGPKGYFVMKGYKKLAADIYNMELKQGDVFVTSYPKSGTTWTQELVWMVANDLDYDKSAAVPLVQRYPFLEKVSLFDETAVKLALETVGDDNDMRRKVIEYMTTPDTQILSGMPSPRFVKTHLPMSLLPPKLLDTAKVVYVARDPRDVAVSWYHHARLYKNLRLKASFKDVWGAFLKDLCFLTPYFEHVKEAWALRHHPNMLFLFYEDLSKDLPRSIRRVADFLGKQLSPDQMNRLCDHLSFQNFKNNKSVNKEDMRVFGLMDSNETFIRKGKTGGWREYFDEEMVQDADRWIADNLRDTDLRFPSMDH